MMTMLLLIHPVYKRLIMVVLRRRKETRRLFCFWSFISKLKQKAYIINKQISNLKKLFHRFHRVTKNLFHLFPKFFKYLFQVFHKFLNELNVQKQNKHLVSLHCFAHWIYVIKINKLFFESTIQTTSCSFS